MRAQDEDRPLISALDVDDDSDVGETEASASRPFMMCEDDGRGGRLNVENVAGEGITLIRPLD
jgi:hypothetical protein